MLWSGNHSPTGATLMRNSLRNLTVLSAALLMALGAGTAFAQTKQSKSVKSAKPMSATPADPYLWLEDVEGAKQLEWVREQNHTTDKYTQSAEFKALQKTILAQLDSKDKIPGVSKIGEHYYNLWTDEANPRGLWRRTTLDEYRKASPAWETVIDFDALGKAENVNWVFKGASCPRPYNRCLVNLSRGGADAVEVREFDLNTKQFIADGFRLPEAKGSMSYIDADTAFVSTDFGPGSMTLSGYPRIVKIWKRGTPLSAAKTVYEIPAKDMAVGAGHDWTPGFERNFVTRMIDFYTNETFELMDDGKLVKIDAPDSSEKSVVKDWLLLRPRFEYTAGGKTFPAGSLIAMDYVDFQGGKRDFVALYTPDANSSLQGFTTTKDNLVLNVLRDVKSQLTVLKIPGKGNNVWTSVDQPGIPQFGTVGVGAVDDETSNELWMTSTDFLNPTTLSLLDIGSEPVKLKSNPVLWDSANYDVTQNFAVSKDGTKIPYFIVKHKDTKLDGTNPTLLYGYGGFEVSMLPSYSGGNGKGWLEKGGVYVLANIRGGGEYGPNWHQSVIKANRHKVYEDFSGVAKDLIARKITSPKHLGVMGGSNGGLLTGNMLTQYPELFGAIVIQVPLLDMQRYHKLLAGNSWMAEYGDPDTADWKFIQTFSPYQLFDAKRKYPATLFTTSTRDDRVHPGHARKMMAKMVAAGKEAYYYENIEGGHGGAATNDQRAFMTALAYTFLWDQLR